MSQGELVEINQNRLNLQDRWQERHKEVLAQLKASWEEFSGQLDRTSEELCQKENRKNEVAAELKIKEAQLDGLEVKVSQSVEKLKNAQESLSKCESQYNQRDSQLKALTEKIDVSRERLHQLQELEKDQTEKLTRTLNAGQFQLEELEKRVKQATEKLAQSERKREKFEIEQGNMTKGLSILQETLTNYESARAQKQAELDRIDKRLKSSREVLSDCESKYGMRLSELQQAKARLDDVKEKLTYLEGLSREQLKKTAEELGSKQLQIEEAKSRLDRLTEHLKKARAQESQLQLERDGAERTWQDRQREWEEKEKDISPRLKSSQEQLKLCEATRTQKRLELEELTRRREKTSQELRQTEGKVKKVDHELETKRLLLEELKVEVSKTEKELKDIQGKRDTFQGELKSLSRAWLNHQAEWRRKEEEILGQFKSLKEEPTRYVPDRTKKPVEHRQIAEQLNPLVAGLEKTSLTGPVRSKAPQGLSAPLTGGTSKEVNPVRKNLEETSIIKLRAKKPGDEAAFLTVYTSFGKVAAPFRVRNFEIPYNEINPLRSKSPKATAAPSVRTSNGVKIDQPGGEAYSGIRIFPENLYVGNHKNLIFFAKSEDTEGVRRALFRVELNNIPMRMGRHYEVEIARSWQKVAIPLEDFDGIIGLDIITAITVVPIFLEGAADGVTYISDIQFSN